MIKVELRVVEMVSAKIKELPLTRSVLSFVDNKDQFPDINAPGLTDY